LLHFPIEYIDPCACEEEIREGRRSLYYLKVEKITLKRVFQKRISVLIVNSNLKNKSIQLIFFNQAYLMQLLKNMKQIYIYGVLNREQDIFKSINPRIIQEKDLNRAIPIYKPLATVKSGMLKKVFNNCFKDLGEDKKLIPACLSKKYNFLNPKKTLYKIHNPVEINSSILKKLKETFIYHEFFSYQFNLQYVRQIYGEIRRVNTYKIDRKMKEALDNSINFKLTTDQILAVEEIVNDLKSGYCMQRMLMGDVGTGKTIVSFIPLLVAVINGYQTGFLAPTEVLIQQHYLNALSFFKGYKIELLTGSTESKKKKQILIDLSAGKIDILFGTHAILNKEVRFFNLSLIVIDEQHRFGVSQRSKLFCKSQSLDLLVTTATPIPRTLLISMYDDLKVSILRKKPYKYLPVITRQIEHSRRTDFYKFLSKKIKGGHKAFIVLPLIEPSEFFQDLYSIKQEEEFFRFEFKDVKMGFLTGRDDFEFKKKIIDRFKEGEIDVLISTTVIEVGIDVPDADFIVIENSGRYGLAQLHQLRGRVGRGSRQSFCYLIKSPKLTDNGQRRLEIICSNRDGFKISEMDLKMRGGGRIFGLEQSGYTNFRVGDPRSNIRIFQAARDDVKDILSADGLEKDPVIDQYVRRIDEEVKDISFS
jgi:ATP-dependent DNA helicase RecG